LDDMSAEARRAERWSWQGCLGLYCCRSSPLGKSIYTWSCGFWGDIEKLCRNYAESSGLDRQWWQRGGGLELRGTGHKKLLGEDIQVAHKWQCLWCWNTGSGSWRLGLGSWLCFLLCAHSCASYLHLSVPWFVSYPTGIIGMTGAGFPKLEYVQGGTWDSASLTSP
jgi:hypothetical protein